MENQHRKIKGYRELSQHDIDLMNEIKHKGVELGELITKLAKRVNAQEINANSEEALRILNAEPHRWLAIARTHFQEGCMAAARAVEQPEFF